MIDNLNNPTIAVSDILEFTNHLSNSILVGTYRALASSSSSYLPLLDTPDSRSNIVDAYLDALIETGKISSLYYAYSGIAPHLRTKMLSSLKFDSQNLKQTLWSIKSDNQPLPKSDLLAEWSRNIDSILHSMGDHMIIKGSGGENLGVLDHPSIIFLNPNGQPLAPERPMEIFPYDVGSDNGTSQPQDDNSQNPTESISGYTFDPYLPYTWNIGLRYLYRQEWRPLGIQRGETVKTIPLGPKQIEKISTKIVKRTKVTTTSESLKSVETTTESTDSTKDSTEIVNEASKSSKWHAEAEASGSWGFGSAKVSGGASGEAEKKAKSASNQLSETMQKTASKIRTESKVIVSTESETTFEENISSEIQNPNDEIALTYVYSKLQRQYEIFTSLNQLDGVLFVAEPMVAASEINAEWVRKYDWIISEVLLDNSFKETLNYIAQEIEPQLLHGTDKDRITNTMDSAKNYLNNFSSKITSLSIAGADVSQEAQKGFRETIKEEIEKEKSIELAKRKKERFLQHIRDNILHYYRAIWSKEDSEQRLLRYEKAGVLIPTVWKLVVDPTQITNPNPETIDLGVQVNAHYEPDTSDRNTLIPITELIQPAQPVGFVGNYAVFRIKEVPKANVDNQYDLIDVVNLAKSPYIDPDSPESLIDPQLAAIRKKEEVPDDIPKKVKLEMVDLVADLRGEYESLSKEKQESFLEERQEFEDSYHEYLFRKRNLRRFVVDTNNLIVDIEIGTGSALESFKKLHRYIDVLKAAEEKDKMKLENERRQKLLAKEKLGDPEIEKVTVVTGNQKALDLTSLDVTDES